MCGVKVVCGSESVRLVEEEAPWSSCLWYSDCRQPNPCLLPCHDWSSCVASTFLSWTFPPYVSSPSPSPSPSPSLCPSLYHGPGPGRVAPNGGGCYGDSSDCCDVCLCPCPESGTVTWSACASSFLSAVGRDRRTTSFWSESESGQNFRCDWDCGCLEHSPLDGSSCQTAQEDPWTDPTSLQVGPGQDEWGGPSHQEGVVAVQEHRGVHRATWETAEDPPETGGPYV
jgi:hypothetical protein